jgi:NAD(P)-dependent dehydrogenase (short-subunit alcohol dehydrogenase family)
MSGTGILKGKHAVVFGAGGSIGAAVAKELAAQGAEVFLSGRSQASLAEVAKAIASADGRAHAEVIDALDDSAVNDYMGRVVKQAGRIDLVFNAMGPRAGDYGNGKHAVDLTTAEFMLPISTIVKSQFITARAAARHMAKQRSGVILFVTGSPARGHVEGATAIGAAFGAIETFMENLAIEIGALGVRAVCLRTTANIDSRAIGETVDALASRMNVPRDQVIARLASLNFLKVPATVADTARAAVFLASDGARMMTGTVVNATAAAALD